MTGYTIVENNLLISENTFQPTGNFSVDPAFKFIYSPVDPDGRVNLNLVRNMYKNNMITFNDVLSFHEKWKNDVLYNVLAYADSSSYGSRAFAHTERLNVGVVTYTKFDYYGFKASKRGNDVHQGRVKNKFKPILSICDKYKDFEFFGKNDKYGSSPAVMLTLSFGARVCRSCSSHFPKSKKINSKSKPVRKCPNCGSSSYYDISITDAWNQLGDDLNRTLSNLKRKYGRISFIRSFESYTNGYPHIHLVMLFKDREFKCKKYLNKKDKYEYILIGDSKKSFDESHHSYVKVNAVRTLGAVTYVSKYCFKNVFDEDENISLVRCWLHGKRQFSISNDFPNVLFELLRNKGHPVGDPLLVTITHNSNQLLPQYNKSFYVGVIYDVKSPNNIIRMKPPPFDGSKSKLVEKYDYDTLNWIKDFSISDTQCSECNKPLFFNEKSTYLIEEEDKTT